MGLIHAFRDGFPSVDIGFLTGYELTEPVSLYGACRQYFTSELFEPDER